VAVAHHLPLLRLTEHLEVRRVVHCDPINHEEVLQVVHFDRVNHEEE